MKLLNSSLLKCGGRDRWGHGDGFGGRGFGGGRFGGRISGAAALDVLVDSAAVAGSGADDDINVLNLVLYFSKK